MIKAPWTPAQVDALNAYQKRHDMHPYTCPGDNGPLCVDRELLATEWGWVCNCGRYTQDWAHATPRTPVLDYPEHSKLHLRIVHEPAPTPAWTDHFVAVCIEHQIAITMLLWLLIMAGVLIWWMA